MALENTHTFLGVFGFLCLVCFDTPVAGKVTRIPANTSFPFRPVDTLSPFFAGPFVGLGEDWLAEILALRPQRSPPFPYCLRQSAGISRQPSFTRERQQPLLRVFISRPLFL